jgi:cytochrome c oxidase subunit III
MSTTVDDLPAGRPGADPRGAGVARAAASGSGRRVGDGRAYSGFDAGHFGGYNQSHEAPIWWGIVGLILIESVVFSTLIASYFYLGFRQPTWPLPGIKDPDLLMPSIGTALLLASSISMALADRAIKRDNAVTLKWGLLISALLAAGFLVLKIIEYSDKEYLWDSHPYGSIVWLIIGFHSMHVVSLLLKTVVVDVLAFRGFFTRRNRIAVTVNGFYWHFVVLVWIPLFAVIYLSPRLS